MSNIRSVSLFAILTALAFVGLPKAEADNGSWDTGASGTWNNSANWSGGTIANGVSSTATIGFTSASRTLSITTSQTTGVINATTTAGGLTIDAIGSGTLVMDNGVAQAQINVTGQAGTVSTVSGPILMTAGGLRVAANSPLSSSFSLSGVSASGLDLGSPQVLSVLNLGSSPFSISSFSDSLLGAQAALLVEGGVMGVSTNTSSGGVTIRNGTIRGGSGALGTGTLTFGDASSIAATANLAFTSGTYANDIVVYNGLQTATMNPNLAAQVAEFSGNVSLGKNLTVLPQLGGSVTFSGSISGVGGLQFDGNNGGDNVVALTGANTFSGGVTFATSGLRLDLGNASALGTGTLSFGTISTNARARMRLDNTSGSSMTLATNNAITLANFTFVGSNSLNTGTGAVTVGPAFSIMTVLGNTLTIGGVISGASKSIGNAGSGTLALTGANTYTGATTVGGVMAVSSLANGGIASNIGQSGTAAANLVLNRGTLLYTGGSSSTDRSFTIGNGGATIESSGSGAVNFTNVSSYVSTGTVNISAGTSGVVLANLATTIFVGNTSNLAVGQSVTGANIAANTVISQIVDGQTVVISNAALGTATGVYTFGDIDRTFTLTGTNSGNNTIAGVLANSPTKSLSVTKSGSGKWILSGANTYTGATTVSAGTLVLSTAGTNNIAGSTKVTVQSGANLDVTGVASGFTLASGQTLDGNGTVVGNMTVAANSTLSPGNSPGTLNQTGNQTWLDGGNYNWQIYDAAGLKGVGYDTIAITGLLDLTSLTGGTDFNINLWSLSAIGPDANGNAINFSEITQSWTLVTASGGISGFNATEFTINTLAANGTSGFSNPFSGTFSVGVVGNDLLLTYTVPEPGTTAMLLAGVGMFFLLKRRRFRS